MKFLKDILFVIFLTKFCIRFWLILIRSIMFNSNFIKDFFLNPDEFQEYFYTTDGIMRIIGFFIVFIVINLLLFYLLKYYMRKQFNKNNFYFIYIFIVLVLTVPIFSLLNYVFNL